METARVLATGLRWPSTCCFLFPLCLWCFFLVWSTDIVSCHCRIKVFLFVLVRDLRIKHAVDASDQENRAFEIT